MKQLPSDVLFLWQKLTIRRG